MTVHVIYSNRCDLFTYEIVKCFYNATASFVFISIFLACSVTSNYSVTKYLSQFVVPNIFGFFLLLILKLCSSYKQLCYRLLHWWWNGYILLCIPHSVSNTHTHDIIIIVTRFPKRSYTCTVSRHTFRRHLLATSMRQQHMWLIQLKVKQSDFTQPFSRAFLVSMTARVTFKWPHLPLVSK